MEISPLKLTELFVLSFIFGGALGVLNDFNRIVRVFFGVRYSSKSFEKLYSIFNIKYENNKDTTKFGTLALNLIIIVQDIFLVITAGIGTILLNYYYNDGKIRLFSLLTLGIGFFLYYFTIGKLVMLISEPIMVIIRELVKYVVRVILLPIKYIVNLLIKSVNNIYLLIKKHLAKMMNIRYNIKEVKRLEILSKIGFINHKEFKNEG